MFCCNCSTKMEEITDRDKLEIPYVYKYKCNTCGTLTGIRRNVIIKEREIIEIEGYYTRSFIPKLFEE